MNILRRLFTAHPTSVGEGYWQHFANAMGFGLRMLWGGLVCIVHAIIPGLFCNKASAMIGELHDRMVANRRRLPTADLAAETRRAA